MENIDKKFETCPVCGSKERFFETLAQELKDLGFARDIFQMHKDYLTGVVIDKAREQSMPIGSEVPTFEVRTDICLDCGNVYAISLVSGKAKKEAAGPKLVLPGDMPFGMPSGDPKHN